MASDATPAGAPPAFQSIRTSSSTIGPSVPTTTRHVCAVPAVDTSRWQIRSLWIGTTLYVRRVVEGFLILFLAMNGHGQAPSTEEQQYLFSVLPVIERGQFADAEQRLPSGIEQYPRSAILYNALGIVYQKQSEIEKAAASFRK